MELLGNIVDVLNRKIFPGKVIFENGKIVSVTQTEDTYNNYILPGFIDAHVHIESSMLVPSEFARLAVLHGTVATVSDPHEIGNVLGVNGVRYMIDNGKKGPFKFYFGAPSCVPATAFETAGAEITSADIRELIEKDGLKYLSEMMNYPGVLFNDPLVMEKIQIAHSLGRPVDGHAPGLRGDDAKKYIAAGISTDHECFTLDEALGKIALGMKIIIREGSAAKNFEALHPLLKDHSDLVMFCSDDKHPNDLLISQINEHVRRAVKYGYDLFNVLFAACVNPVKHYGLDVGLLKPGDNADLIIVNNLTDFKVQQTYINGELVANNGVSLVKKVKTEIINNFNTSRKSIKDFELDALSDGAPKIRVIKALDGQLLTEELREPAKLFDAKLISNTDNDVLKMAVVCRYNNSKPAIGFIRGFGFKKGAIASCVAHDSHNIIAVGVTDEDICHAVNSIIDYKGGISAAFDDIVEVLPLPVGGIMSNDDCYTIAEKYTAIDKISKDLGSNLHAPYMTLSFMALLVIPLLKLSDKGLFDSKKFGFVDLFV
ncbi:MAG: adenine deaminase [Ignavibacteria bacterium]|nr:adenine deaminase [Ignavibacteria bacterium]